MQEALQPAEEVAPPPKPKSKESLKKINSIFTKPVEKVGKPVEKMATAAEEEQPVEKKKKRKLGGLGEKTAFVWDQIQVRYYLLSSLGEHVPNANGIHLHARIQKVQSLHISRPSRSRQGRSLEQDGDRHRRVSSRGFRTLDRF